MNFEVEFSDKAKEDIQKHKKFGNIKNWNKIKELIEDICSSPFEGKGKPEPLKYKFSGKWSRRIDKEHRLIYEIKEDIILIYSAFGHYK
ncbi:MAG: Txe/YoeB family addiction module toxin [Cytophagales bacterium]